MKFGARIGELLFAKKLCRKIGFVKYFNLFGSIISLINLKDKKTNDFALFSVAWKRFFENSIACYGVQTFHHLTFIHPTVNHGHLITRR